MPAEPLDAQWARRALVAALCARQTGDPLVIELIAPRGEIPPIGARIAEDLAWLGIAPPKELAGGVTAAVAVDPDIGALEPDSAGGSLPAIADLRRAGFLPGAVAAHLLIPGWVPPTEQAGAVIAPEFIAAYDPARMRAARPFDEPGLRRLNARMLTALPADRLGTLIADAMQAHRLLEDPIPAAARRWIATFITAFGDAFATLGEALAIIAGLRAEAVLVPALELERLRSRQVVFFLDGVGQYVDAQPELRDLPLSHDLSVIGEEFGVAPADAAAAVRMALTGQAAGPPLELLFPLLGHDRILIRIGAISSHLLHGRGLEPLKFGPGGVPFHPIPAGGPPVA